MELHRIHRHNHAGYPDEIRQTAVKMYLLEMRSKAEIIRRYGVSYASLDKWILKFGPQILADNNLKIACSSLDCANAVWVTNTSNKMGSFFSIVFIFSLRKLNSK
jgi:hypothetical protein